MIPVVGPVYGTVDPYGLGGGAVVDGVWIEGHGAEWLNGETYRVNGETYRVIDGALVRIVAGVPPELGAFAPRRFVSKFSTRKRGSR